MIWLCEPEFECYVSYLNNMILFLQASLQFHYFALTRKFELLKLILFTLKFFLKLANGFLVILLPKLLTHFQIFDELFALIFFIQDMQIFLIKFFILFTTFWNEWFERYDSSFWLFSSRVKEGDVRTSFQNELLFLHFLVVQFFSHI